MSDTLSKKDFPIQPICILKDAAVGLLAGFVIGVIFGTGFNNLTMVPFFGFGLPIVSAIATAVQLKRFDFFLEDKALRIEDYYLSKSDRYIPYPAIQNVVILRDLVDKMAGTSSLFVEIASQQRPQPTGMVFSKASLEDTSSKGVEIPGLKLEQAERLKAHLLENIAQCQGDPTAGL